MIQITFTKVISIGLGALLLASSLLGTPSSSVVILGVLCVGIVIAIHHHQETVKKIQEKDED